MRRKSALLGPALSRVPLAGCEQLQPDAPPQEEMAAQQTPEARGEHLVTAAGCAESDPFGECERRHSTIAMSCA